MSKQWTDQEIAELIRLAATGISYSAIGEQMGFSKNAIIGFAKLTRANLTGANLTGAILIDANLTDANLTGADLTGADLTGANLTSANLADANMVGADLTDANLTGCITLYTDTKRRYVLRVIPEARELMFVAGCRTFTLTEAREHWGAGRESSQPKYIAAIEKFVAEHHTSQGADAR